jgi:hypothetical protein
MIKFLLLVNKQGQTRLARYFGDELRGQDERRALEAEAVRRCLARSDRQASFFEHRSHRIVYRRYASLFFLAGVDEDEVREDVGSCFSRARLFSPSLVYLLPARGAGGPTTTRYALANFASLSATSSGTLSSPHAQ